MTANLGDDQRTPPIFIKHDLEAPPGLGQSRGRCEAPARPVQPGRAAPGPTCTSVDPTAAGFVDLVAEVFGMPETVEARSPMPHGTLVHAQLRLGTVGLMVADGLDGWSSRPGLLQVGVGDWAAVLERAGAHCATGH